MKTQSVKTPFKVNIDSFTLLECDRCFVFKGITDEVFENGSWLKSEGLLFRMSGNALKGSIYYESGFKNYYLPDPKNYMFLIAEKKIVPKLLCTGIPKELKRKALPDECFVSSEGDFFRVPPEKRFEDDLLSLSDEPSLRLFRNSLSKKQFFIKKDPQQVTAEWLSTYADLMIKSQFR